MATPVEVPKLGNTVEECLITRWAKHTGDTVSAGDLVAEIETDKATFEVTAPVDGAILATFFEEGALVRVFTNLFVVGNPGEDVEAYRPQGAALARETVAPAAAAHARIAPLANARGSEAILSRDPEGAVVNASQHTSPAALGGTLSPRARRFAQEHNFHPATVNGSGPGGRVLEEDLRALYYSASPPVRASRGPAPTPAPAPPAPRASNIREKIARRMRESLASTAQYTLNASADAAGLIALRARIKASKDLPGININDLVMFCAIRALEQMPELNAEYINGEIRAHREIHLGFACDTPRGLLVPVIRNAHELSISELAEKAKELTTQAVQGGIAPDNLSGATFTVSNLGALGIESFTPLLNPPQVAILGVGAIQAKPVRRDGRVEIIDSIGLSLTCDHQVIDGAPGARFLQVLKQKIENVESECTI
jgi:pyruvate dehydrogenase E2 component (dihydrolipoamide acetyltransferase)